MASAEIFEQIQVPLPRSPKRRHIRDSLHRRMDTGNPGSKRYQRWFNGNFLEEQAASLGVELDWNLFDSRSPFRSLFEGNYLEAFEMYFDVCEEKELELMMPFDNKSPSNKKREYKVIPPSQSYRHLDKQYRKTIENLQQYSLLAAVDKQVVEFIQHMTKRKVVQLDDPYHRLLCHSIATFYSLLSQSQDTRNGQRVVILSKPDFMTLPACTLSEYLKCINI